MNNVIAKQMGYPDVRSYLKTRGYTLSQVIDREGNPTDRFCLQYRKIEEALTSTSSVSKNAQFLTAHMHAMVQRTYQVLNSLALNDLITGKPIIRFLKYDSFVQKMSQYAQDLHALYLIVEYFFVPHVKHHENDLDFWVKYIFFSCSDRRDLMKCCNSILTIIPNDDGDPDLVKELLSTYNNVSMKDAINDLAGARFHAEQYSRTVEALLHENCINRSNKRSSSVPIPSNLSCLRARIRDNMYPYLNDEEKELFSSSTRRTWSPGVKLRKKRVSSAATSLNKPPPSKRVALSPVDDIPNLKKANSGLATLSQLSSSENGGVTILPKKAHPSSPPNDVHIMQDSQETPANTESKDEPSGHIPPPPEWGEACDSSMSISGTTKPDLSKDTVEEGFITTTWFNPLTINERFEPSKCSIASHLDLRSLNSRVVVKIGDVDHVAHCAPLEYYLHDNLTKHEHSFDNKTPLSDPRNGPRVTVNYPQMVDHISDDVSIIRGGGELFDKHFSDLKVCPATLIKFVLQHGYSNDMRDGEDGPGTKRRFDIGNAGQAYTTSDDGLAEPIETYGFGVFDKMNDENLRELILAMIADMCDHSQDCEDEIEMAILRNGRPFSCTIQDGKYGKALREKIGATRWRRENITLQVKCISRGERTCNHTDKLNSKWRGFTKTSGLCFFIKDAFGDIWSVKLLGNGRSKLDNYYEKKYQLVKMMTRMRMQSPNLDHS